MSGAGEARGLSAAQAQALLREHGPNDFRPRRRLEWLRRLGGVLSEPTLLVLLAVLAFYLAIGSKGEAALLGAFVAIVISVTYFEELRTQRAVEALASFASPRAVLLRDGAWQRIPGIEAVPGDLLKAGEGDRVPADARLLEAHDLKLDESLLTGESQAAERVLENGAPEEERLLRAGTLVLQGHAIALVTATGRNTAIGRLSRSLAEIRPEPTPFQKSAGRLVRLLGVVAALACLSVVLLNWRRGLPLAESVLQGLTLAIATVPEELPVILAVFMAMGARRLAREGVLAARVAAVETLGALTLLAVDKTGTLTKNEMRLKQALPLFGADEASLLRSAAEASELEPFDPMERAILARSGAAQGELSHEYALAGRPPRMGHVWDQKRVAAKGSVEGILQHCVLGGEQLRQVRELEQAWAAEGLRVLAVAAGSLDGPPPAELPHGLRLLGLLAFEDPLREGVAEALASAKLAGIRVVMMTGDSAATAQAIAAQAGMDGAAKVVEGSLLESEPGRIPELAREVSVFARMAPEHKLILVQAWSRQGEVVGMTGDGVNDAPAIAQAHVGIGLGKRGTDVAREAAAIVLSDDSFLSLLKGVELGRQITGRILRAALFVLAVHVPIIALVLCCLLFKLPPLIEAAQIAFLELFIGPTCSVIFERAPGQAGLMQAPPRDPKAPFLAWKPSLKAMLQGLAIFAGVMFFYLHGLATASAGLARSQAFFALMLADFLLCWTMLSERPFWAKERWNNGAFWILSAGVLGLLLLLLRMPLTSSLFHMAWPGGLGAALALAAACTLWNEAAKALPHGKEARHA
jgi:Ca2+-transporting ATPase